MKFILMVTLFLFYTDKTMGQNMTTKETKVVFVVNKNSNEIIHLDLFDEISEIEKKALRKNFLDCRFYLGFLKGSYEIMQDGGIKPHKDTILSIYTTNPIWEDNGFLKAIKLKPGETLSLGSKSKTKVITSKKGLLTLKTL